MKITKSYIEKLAYDLLKEHGLLDSGWDFKWDNAKRSFGQCNYLNKTISVSRFLFNNTVVEDMITFDDTVKHEIAHALAFTKHNHRGHGRIWKQYAIQLGAKPTSFDNVQKVNPLLGIKYVLVNTADNDRVIRKYFRKPSVNRIKWLHSDECGLRGKPETKGKLRIKTVNHCVIGEPVFCNPV